mmetsp:Transcript_45355/g.33138  ORF Transcript_45355/g.33138 Transcript_45355/m.33138 type:complete len:420 (-) Transcript_45355:823-2082(-)
MRTCVANQLNRPLELGTFASGCGTNEVTAGTCIPQLSLEFEEVPKGPESEQEAPSKSKRRSRRARLGRKFSTTSTVLARNTITNPNFSQVNYCIGATIQAQIFDDLFIADKSKGTPLEFNLLTGLSPEDGGITYFISEQVLDFETQFDDELREKILSMEVPTIDTIYRFIVTVINRACYSIECNILALIYVNRMTKRRNFALTMDNWRGFWVSAVMLAQKVWNDRPLRTSTFSEIIPCTTKEHMKILELSGFRMLEFETRVKPSSYAKYYFELRKLYGEIVGPENFETWNMSPLGVAEEKRLEYRSSLPGMQYIESMSSSSDASIASNYPVVNILSTARSITKVTPPKERVAVKSSSPESDQLPPINTLNNQENAHARFLVVSNTYSPSLPTLKRRTAGVSKTTEDLDPVNSIARFVIS